MGVSVLKTLPITMDGFDCDSFCLALAFLFCLSHVSVQDESRSSVDNLEYRLDLIEDVGVI